jgi:hypothetical protein
MGHTHCSTGLDISWSLEPIPSLPVIWQRSIQGDSRTGICDDMIIPRFALSNPVLDFCYCNNEGDLFIKKIEVNPVC